MSESSDIIIVGGGVIGLSIADELARAGVGVRVFDRRAPDFAASWAGAGIIAPLAETPSQDASSQLRYRSAARYQDWSLRLLEETGIDNGYRRCGGVDIAATEEEDEALHAMTGRWRKDGVCFERMLPKDFARVEPSLNPNLFSLYFLPERAQVRNPRHLRALRASLRLRGVNVHEDTEVVALRVQEEHIISVITHNDTFWCSNVVVAAGPWTARLLEPLGLDVPTPPIKGEIVLLKAARRVLSRIIEHGKHYLVPRDDGRVLVGATEESVGFDTSSTEDARLRLLTFAHQTCPILANSEFEVERVWAGLRPGSSDSRPYLGRSPNHDNLFIASGHARMGLQLAPATAEVMTDLILKRPPRIDLSRFRIGRELDASDPLDWPFRS